MRFNYPAYQMPDFMAEEQAVFELKQNLMIGGMLDSVSVAASIANLSVPSRQLALAWQSYYRKQLKWPTNSADRLEADTLPAVADSLVLQTICERFRGHTLYVQCFHSQVWSPLVHELVKPLQQELADLDIVWINLWGTSGINSFKQEQNAFRYITSEVEGVNYQIRTADWMANRMKGFLKSVTGCQVPWDFSYCIVAPDGTIVRQTKDSPGQNPLTDYLGIRYCLQQTASPKHIGKRKSQTKKL